MLTTFNLWKGTGKVGYYIDRCRAFYLFASVDAHLRDPLRVQTVQFVKTVLRQRQKSIKCNLLFTRLISPYIHIYRIINRQRRCSQILRQQLRTEFPIYLKMEKVGDPVSVCLSVCLFPIPSLQRLLGSQASHIVRNKEKKGRQTTNPVRIL